MKEDYNRAIDQTRSAQENIGNIKILLQIQRNKYMDVIMNFALDKK